MPSSTGRLPLQRHWPLIFVMAVLSAWIIGDGGVAGPAELIPGRASFWVAATTATTTTYDDAPNVVRGGSGEDGNHLDLHAFVRGVHLLQDAVTEVERAQPEHFQFEVFHVGEFARGQDSRAP